MISAETPKNESERLARLGDLAILDTPPEQAFDELTQLASTICGTPIALVSLVDRHRQWFKARVGLDAPETGRDIAFCSHAILGDSIFEVQDASQDERFHDNPLVADDPSIRFYAGMPLVTADGYALGTLCVIDRVPRALDATQREALRVLGRQVIAQLEMRRIARAAVEHNHAKSQFLASISHELRTPLNAILGFSKLLAKRSEDERSADFAGRIHSSGKRLLGLVNDLLDLSKVEAGKLELRTRACDVDSLCRSVVEELAVVAHEGVELSYEGGGPAIVEADPPRLRQILVNLVGNALKFTDEGQVRIVLHSADGLPPTALSVVDTGVGIPADEQARIFRPFEQADALADDAEREPGTGLGLALSKRLADQMGFRLGVDSKVGEGSTFTLEFATG